MWSMNWLFPRPWLLTGTLGNKTNKHNLAAKFEVVTFNVLGGDASTRKFALDLSHILPSTLYIMCVTYASAKVLSYCVRRWVYKKNTLFNL